MSSRMIRDDVGSSVLFRRSLTAEGFRHQMGRVWQTDRIQANQQELGLRDRLALQGVGAISHAVTMSGILGLLVSGAPPPDLADLVVSWSCCLDMSLGPSGDSVMRLADGAWILYYQRATAVQGSEIVLSCGFESAFRTSMRGQKGVWAFILHPCAGLLLIDDGVDSVVRGRRDLTTITSWAGPLRDRLDESRWVGEGIHAVWDCLRTVRRSRLLPSYHLAWAAIGGMDAADGPADIAHLARDLGVSTRTLERSVLAHTGLPPKQMSRLRRLMKTVPPASQGRALAWAGLAAQTGFSDQSHLVREFGRVYGMTPEEFRQLVGVRGFRSEGYVVLPNDLNTNATP